MTQPSLSRRRFLGQFAAATGAAAAPFALNLAAMGAAAAADATDYKALVCLFMAGGNDHFNTILPTDRESWNEYVRLRTTTDAGSIALPALGATGGVLEITPATRQAGRSFAIHPAMQPLKNLFERGKVAVLANVGTLVQPTTLKEYQAGTALLPDALFSHNNQQAVWQSSQGEGKSAVGWGGRMADMMMSANSSSTFAAISAGGNSALLNGNTCRQYQISPSGVRSIYGLNTPMFGLWPSSNPLRQIIAGTSTDLMQKEHAAVVQRAIAAQDVLGTAMLPAGTGGVPDPTPFINPNTGLASVNPLARQLQAVARIIGGRNALGVKRQVFYVSLGGFDFHDNQRVNQATMLAMVAHAMAYFDGVIFQLGGAGLYNGVTTFTASDFGRTFASNGDGTDHGWGSHHFIMGGAVKGRDIYGTIPETGVGHELDVGSGALLPTIAVDQYGATLASWFGLSASQLIEVFPNLGRFGKPNLGFMI